MKTRRLVLTGAAGLLVPASLYSYALLSPRRTWDGPPQYIVDNRGLAGVADSDGGATRVRNAILAWNAAGSGKVLTAAKGSVGAFSLGDGKPMINFQDPLAACTGNCLAATFTSYYSLRGGSSYRIDDADMVTNTTNHLWTSQGEDPGGVGCLDEFYVEGVMVHEIGHALGLGHTGVSGATMYPTVSACNNGPATIETDDRSGIKALYGTAPCSGCSVYTNFLPGSGSSLSEPKGTYYYSSAAGSHSGFLSGPAGADFDLYLFKWSGSSWEQVASSESASASESISHYDGAGYYTWLVSSYSGSGEYHFWLTKP